ncbi:hypothetical protein A8B84_00490 [Marinobacter sp. EhC06]|uniref:hypothetical protein n=1 Tax=Marinobacter TaxID=2742 RepID=UPI0007D95A48|nr:MULTISPECIES: hypothetical protein [unclassified Marinobacter]OAN90361.1 hypothetical protein A8B80_02670 [Marinobacter sp. EhN04]OAN96919.1 hypothetical protein A8B84_00490 [Marinobacter sp. EhC06]
MVFKSLGVILLAGLLGLAGCDSDEKAPAAESGKVDAENPDLQTGDISLALTSAQLDWVGQQIFRNECAGRFQCLVHWNDGEAFPSLGIGHFIWYPKGVEGRFVESFPALMEYMEQRQVNIPEWLRALEPFDAPWSEKAEFLAVDDSPRLAELREFLAGTQGIQAEFIFRRARESLGRIVEAAPDDRKSDVADRLEALSQTPGGVYAIIDYVNFKGEGLSSTERYNDQGWGLLQVLLEMSGSPDRNALGQFREAAGTVLTRRAENAKDPIERERWLPGWLRRLETYKEPPVFKISE